MEEMDNSFRTIINGDEYYRQATKKALMLYFAGPEVNEIFDTLEDSEAETDYKAAVETAMAQYVSRFIPGYDKIIAPLQNLTKQGVEWKWTENEQTALDNLKETHLRQGDDVF